MITLIIALYIAEIYNLPTWCEILISIQLFVKLIRLCDRVTGE